jgi:hypothetical protein
MVTHPILLRLAFRPLALRQRVILIVVGTIHLEPDVVEGLGSRPLLTNAGAPGEVTNAQFRKDTLIQLGRERP